MSCKVAMQKKDAVPPSEISDFKNVPWINVMDMDHTEWLRYYTKYSQSCWKDHLKKWPLPDHPMLPFQLELDTYPYKRPIRWGGLAGQVLLCII